ncbi:MAG: hypothetical protein R3232_10395 [Clostridia bacterium]|nr:hypothetical protein [Clostridia bacterium]
MKRFFLLVSIFSVILSIMLAGCNKPITENVINKPKLNIDDATEEPFSDDEVLTAETRHNDVFAGFTKTYMMTFYGLLIKMEYDYLDSKFKGDLINLTDKNITIVSICTLTMNGFRSESAENITLSPGETLQITLLPGDEQDVSNWQPYLEVVVDSASTENSPSNIQILD